MKASAALFRQAFVLRRNGSDAPTAFYLIQGSRHKDEKDCNYYFNGDHMSEKMECMCLECGTSSYLLKDDITMDDPASTESKILASLIVCQICGGKLSLVGKAGDEPFYRLE